MAFKSYKEGSRTDWGRETEGGLTIEQINCGAILRIADATEKMATNHVRLQNDYDSMKRDRDYYMDRAHKAERSITAMKGVITKLKKR
jgi:hypothetical protein